MADNSIAVDDAMPKGSILAIFAASAGAFAFLLWLIYVNEGSESQSEAVAFLPAVNATLNGLSAVCLCAGFVAIRRKRIRTHVTLMLTALALSALFLVSYVIYHNYHGDTPFTGQGPIRAVYFFILISHIAATVFALPMILTTVFFAVTRRFARHKRLARFTLPIWLYVSVTGVAIFLLLRAHS